VRAPPEELWLALPLLEKKTATSAGGRRSGAEIVCARADAPVATGTATTTASAHAAADAWTQARAMLPPRPHPPGGRARWP